MNFPVNLTYIPFQRSHFESLKEFRQCLENHLQYTLIGERVINVETGLVIQFYNQGIKKIVHSIGDLKAIIVCNIKILLPDAKLIEIQRDKKERADVYRILKLSAQVLIRGEQHENGFLLKNELRGNFYILLI